MSKSTFLFISCIISLFAIGLVMVFNTTSAEILDKELNVDTHLALYRQIAYGAIGLFAGICFYLIGFERFMRSVPLLFFLCSLALICVFLPIIGHEYNGGKRWIGYFGITFQPSEFAKYIFPFYFIYHITKVEKVSAKFFYKLVFTIGIPTFLILIEPDNGTTAIILLTLLVLFALTRIPWVYWVLPAAAVFLVGGIAAYNMPHVHNRIRVYLNPELDLQGKGHQPYQAKIAAGSGGLYGKGLGESLQKMNYLPEARSDYIAAIIAEEFGFLGIALLISLYMLLAFSGFHIAASSIDRRGFLVAGVMTFLIAFQAFLNLGVVSNLLPSKGTTLPFISQGGSSLIANMIALFLMLSIAKRSSKKEVVL